MSPPDNPDAIQALGDFFDEAPPPQPGRGPKPPAPVPGPPPAAPPAPLAPDAMTMPTMPRLPAPAPAMPSPASGQAPPAPPQQAARPVPPAITDRPVPPAITDRPEPPRVDPAVAAPFAPTIEADEELVIVAPKPQPKRESAPPKQWRCKAGKTIFQEEESSFDIFILEEGKVEIVVADERVAVVDKPGVALGEIGALLRRPRSAMVRTLTPCTFTVYRDFEALLHHDPDKLLEVARTLAQRLADSNDRIQKVFGILYQAKVRDEVVDNVALAFQGKRPKPNQKQGFLAKLGF